MRSIFLLVAIVMLASSCKKKKEKPSPSAAELLSPAKNEICSEGRSISTLESAVKFDWEDAANTDSYQLNLKNLVTGVTTIHLSSKSEIELTIPKGKAFSWSVISKSSSTPNTSTSEIWKFYSAGGFESHAPSSPDLINPQNGINVYRNASVLFNWECSDVDNDIVDYDFYFGMQGSLVKIMGNSKDKYYTYTIPSTTSYYTDYYWKVVARDSKGNTSDSPIYKVFVYY